MVFQEHNVANQQPVHYVLQCFMFYSTKTQNGASLFTRLFYDSKYLIN